MLCAGPQLAQRGQRLHAAFRGAPDELHAITTAGELQRHCPARCRRSRRHQRTRFPFSVAFISHLRTKQKTSSERSTDCCWNWFLYSARICSILPLASRSRLG